MNCILSGLHLNNKSHEFVVFYFYKNPLWPLYILNQNFLKVSNQPSFGFSFRGPLHTKLELPPWGATSWQRCSKRAQRGRIFYPKMLLCQSRALQGPLLLVMIFILLMIPEKKPQALLIIQSQNLWAMIWRMSRTHI